MDSEYPASLSQKVHDILRNEFKFDGVIMTDDLIMDAITDFTGDEAAAVTAAKCGNDLLCCSSVDTQYPAVLEAVQNGEIPEAQVDASVKRILKWKQNLGIFNIDTYQKKSNQPNQRIPLKVRSEKLIAVRCGREDNLNRLYHILPEYATAKILTVKHPED